MNLRFLSLLLVVLLGALVSACGNPQEGSQGLGTRYETAGQEADRTGNCAVRGKTTTGTLGWIGWYSTVEQVVCKDYSQPNYQHTGTSAGGMLYGVYFKPGHPTTAYYRDQNNREHSFQVSTNYWR